LKRSIGVYFEVFAHFLPPSTFGFVDFTRFMGNLRFQFANNERPFIRNFVSIDIWEEPTLPDSAE
jgi:hypothetical protein